MKLTKKLEAEVLKVYKAYWDTYLNGDMKRLASMLDDEVTVFGTAISEVFNNKKETLRFYKATADQLVGKVQFRNRKINVNEVDNNVLVNEQCDLYFLMDKKWTFYAHVRVSAILKHTKTGWKLVHQHASFPDMRAEEGEQLAAEKIKAENIQLRDAVKRRTIELEEKNRELEIESSLEKVRAQALGMHKPGDLLNVCKVLFKELSLLGFSDIRNAIIHTFNDAENYFIDYDYSDLTGGVITNIPYSGNPIIERFLKQIRKSNEAFAEITVKGKELNEWKKFRKSGGQPDDPRLDKTSALYYYLHSVGTGDIGISTFSSINEEKLQLLKRFRNVFDLAYKRYEDITKAEAQAREAKIEAALERVRSRSMGMQKSDELSEVVGVLYKQFEELDFGFYQVLVSIYDKKNNIIEWWSRGFGDIDLPQRNIIPIIDHPFCNDLFEKWENDVEYYPHVLEGDMKKSWEKYLFTKTDLKNFPQEVKDTMRGIDKVYLSDVFMKYGSLQAAGPAPLPDDKAAILKRFVKVVDHAYTRMKDLQTAEMQTREAQIELGLERVRSRAMAMQTSEELNELIGTVFTELTKLDFVLTRCVILIYEGDEKGVRWWMANSEAPSMPMNFFVKYADLPFFNAYLKGWHQRSLKWQYILEGEDKIRTDNVLFNETELSLLPDFVIAGMKANSRVYLSASFNNYGCLNLASLEPLSDEHFDILLRFAKVFDLTYTRFNDLKQAEAQARESKIQLALERVRARTMAMQRSDELMETAVVLFDQLRQLGENIERTMIGVMNEEERVVDVWATRPDGSQMVKMLKFPIDEPILMQKVYAAWRQQKKSIVIDLRGEELESYFQFLKSRSPQLKRESFGERRVENFAFFSKGMLGVINADPETPANIGLYERFAAVFEQTYTRFLDLQKAEAQTREAQIEAALERVRSRTMAMYNSEDVTSATETMFDEFKKLGIDNLRCGIANIHNDRTFDVFGITNLSGGKKMSGFGLFGMDELPIWQRWFESWINKEEVFIAYIAGKEKEEYFRNINDHLNYLPQQIIDFPDSFFQAYYFEQGSVWAYTLLQHSESEKQIMKRFASAFSLTFRRYQDLKQAEAQTREAQIELALERVRARTMAMHKSEELSETASVLFHELKNLGIQTIRSGVGIFNADTDTAELWLTSESDKKIETRILGTVHSSAHPAFQTWFNAWKQKKPSFTFELTGDAVRNYYETLSTYLSLPPQQFYHSKECLNGFFFPEGSLNVITQEPLSEESSNIMLRFARVFGLLYRRFLDLQNAELQAREAQIELGLERVRARAMAMQKSDELADAAQLLYHEFGNLGINTFSCGYMFIDEQKNTQTAWVVLPDGSLLPNFIVFPLTGDHVLDSRYKDWKEKKPLHTFEIQGEVNKEHHRFLSNYVPPFVIEDIFSKVPDRVVFHCANFSDGYLLILATELFPPEEQQTIIRFAKVFEMTYTRFNDLKQAEAQAREAKIEAALERVRSRTMAMHKSDELNETNTVIIQQIKSLEIPLYAFGIHICHADEPISEAWMGDPVGGYMPKVIYRHSHDPISVRMYSGWKEGNTLMVEKLEGDALKEHFEYMMTLVPDRSTFDNLVAPESLVFHFAYFNYGFFVFLTQEHCPEEHSIFTRLAKVFEQTYTRFLDLQKAEAQVREGQIEAALEKVRSRSLAMHKSDELQEVVNTVFERLEDLNIEMDSANIAIFKEGTRDYDYWIASHFQKRAASFHMPYLDLSLTRDITAARESGADFSATAYSFEEKNEWFDYAFKNTDFRFLTEERKQFILNAPGITVAIAFSKHTGVQINRYSSKLLTEGEAEILKRFSRVFEQAYIRFLDLQKAEAQANEARIEIALERIRARALAMHKSDELMEVAKVMREQMALLGQAELEASAVHLYEADPDHILSWRAVTIGSDAKRELTFGHMAIPKKSCEFVREWLTKFYSDLKEYTIELSGSKQQEWYEVLFTLAPEVVNSMRQKNSTHEKRYYRFSKFSGGALLMISKQEPSTEVAYLQSRAAVVFDLAYRRFSDLQKAEAQARDAQIESSLERVRSKTMAMHNSQDVADTVATMFDELVKLGIQTLRCGVGILHEEYQMELWTAKPDETGKIELFVGHLDMKIHSLLKGGYESWRDNRDSYSYELKDDDLIAYFNAINNYSDYHANYDIASLPSRIFHNLFNFNEGTLFVFSVEQLSPEASQIFKRFAGVFGQTYRRYLDLQKAEAQAREARIEAALERVRAKAMAMHKSDDLHGAVTIMFEEFQKLNLDVLRCGIGILNKDSRTGMSWITSVSDNGHATVQASANESFDTHPLMMLIYECWQKQEDLDYVLQGQDLIDYYSAMDASELKLPRSQLLFSGDELQPQYYYVAMFKAGGLYSFRDKPFAAEDKNLMKRFASVVNLTYNRFLDLQKAEAQAREAKIEASLERVRAKAMAMHKSEDLNSAVATVFDELDKLDLGVLRCGISILDKEKRTGDIWVTSITDQGSAVQVSGDESFDIHPLLQGAFEAWLKKEDFSYLLEGDDLAQYYKAVKAANFQLPDSQIITSETEFKKQYCYTTPYGAGGLFAFRETEFPDEAKTVMKRFAGVFDLTYKRFLDLQKAEANAREAKIEAALERVRSRTMAMHKSDELSETAVVLFKQLSELGNDPDRFSIGIIDEEANVMNVYATDQEGSQVNIRFKARMDEKTTIDRMYKGWKAKLKSDVIHLQGKNLENWIKYLRDELGMAINIEHFKGQRFHNVAYFSQGWLNFTTIEPTSPETISLLERFAAVFNLTYRRFLDLQKAEANAREAQIEAGLERVRARTMAMHSSDDVSAATATMFTELEKLGIEYFRGGIAILLHNRTQEVWSVNNLAEGKIVKAAGTFNIDDHPFWQHMYKEWEDKKEFLYYFLAGKDKEDYVKILSAAQNYLPQSILQFPDVHFQVYYFGEGAVFTNSLQSHSEEDKQVMKKFASVFSLTFRRYQDLKKAEAQAREATIEAALEKVRGKAMAMHNSTDLSVTTSMIITELRKLGIKPIRCGVGIINKEAHKAQLYTATSSPEGDSLSVVGWVLLKGHPVLEAIYEKWLAGEDYFPELSGDSRKAYYEQLLAGLSVPLPDFRDDQKHYGHFFSISVGCLYAWADVIYNDDEIKILKRFASIIDLTFRRYFELQKSEENAREAVKQAALDRIRADIASMRTISDLDRITPLIWNELTILGIPFIRCGVFIMDETQKIIHTFLSTPDGKAIAAFHLPYDTPGNFRDMLSHWYNKKTYVSHWNETDFIGIAETLVKQGAVASKEQYLGSLPKGGFYLHFLPFLQGMLYAGNTEQLDSEQIELIQHVADAFSTAYARYEDFTRLDAAKQQVEQTLTDLKQAQTQLVQSEKMASLGELTAGIAHEIQNPLNFVNNFSDVSNELLEEMKIELEKGNAEDAMAIVEDVKQNLEKILHHGKRADAIVKGMLQHSRTSSGQKEPTDINVLADEYLRLSFHGLRAKDKSFNAKFETEFDNSIGKINVIPQDIGRVILNLINNAFYAVTEKKKQTTNGYEPIVTVTTKKDNGRVEITVKDNGNGIPQKVLDKIFQPFFTTKPTGQGTGLGLSLSYDIVTKGHGGELKVETKEGEGSEFIIQIPAN